MRLYLKIFFLILLQIFVSLPAVMAAEVTTLQFSVEQALGNNPQLQALTHKKQALRHELNQAHGGYLPSIDLRLGYGEEQHSDDATRRPAANPSNNDWDTRGDASLTLTQRIYDGGETGSQVSIRNAQLDSTDYQLKAAAQTIALEAVTAHLNVFRQRAMVALAEKSLLIQRDIHRLIAEREKAGAGSIADVTQVRARLAHTESALYLSQANLGQAVANYTRLTGASPGVLAPAGVPATLPQTLVEALQRAEQGNPELLAMDADLAEAESKVMLARSVTNPKIEFELSSRYNDQLEGDHSWQNTNAAMLYLRWNLFDGGQGKAGANAALSRKHQSISKREAKLIELKEVTSTVWSKYLSLQRQKAAFRSAVNYSRKTFDVYLKQFSISQRNLLDVLNAVNDYFQSAVQLVTVGMNEKIVAYRILALTGSLEAHSCSETGDNAEEYSQLTEGLVLSLATQFQSPAPTIAFSDPEPDRVQDGAPVREESIAGIDPKPKKRKHASIEKKSTPLFAIEIGPCINQFELDQAVEVLRQYEISMKQISGLGPVKMVRLIEGVYPPDEARRRLAVLKKTVDSAFLLPAEGKLELYAGSFRESDRARHFSELLAQKKIKVTAVVAEIQMQGRILVVQQVDQQTAEEIAGQMSVLGLTAKLTPLI
ncbi:MAG: TolC family outer membrane protein [Desulfobacterales bacterium]|nr:TolC family outer membrane protein [Desulfobacterales bacterium]